MRLSALSTHLRILLVIPFFAGMLALPANAEPDLATSTPAVAGPNEAAGVATAEQNNPNAKTGESQSAPKTGSQSSPNAQSGTAQPAAKPAVEGAEAQPRTGQTGEAEAKASVGTPKSNILVNIDKSTQEMTVFVDGVELYSWPVSTGKPGYSTPSGTFTTSSMNKIWYSKQWDNAPMYHAIFFTKKGHAIHGTLEERNLGKAASHGCVRISRKNAETLFALVQQNGLENTQVVLTGETPGGEGPAVASQGGRQPKGYPPPWFVPGDAYQDQPRRRRGLFGRWFQPYGDAQGYNAPRGNYYYQPRGVAPRGW